MNDYSLIQRNPFILPHFSRFPLEEFSPNLIYNYPIFAILQTTALEVFLILYVLCQLFKTSGINMLAGP